MEDAGMKKRYGLLMMSIAAGMFAFAAAPAGAASLAFDFDDDADPSTIRNVVHADSGDFVEAYLVLSNFPPPFNYLWGMQFGIEYDPTLDFRGMAAVNPRAGVLHDGTEGIAFAFGTGYARPELPVFTVRFVFRVLETGTHQVAVVPSTGWDHDYDGVVFALSRDATGEIYVIEDTQVLADQIVGIVTSEMTPVRETSWGTVKRLFSDDTM
jgi:hypothetical protein